MALFRTLISARILPEPGGKGSASNFFANGNLMSTSTTTLELTSINTIRTLAMDAVQKANSGHPGTPMALAPAAYTLMTRHMKYDPTNPNWIARDRFVLSCGHASMLLYSMIHLGGIKKLDDNGNPTDAASITLDDIKNFRQLHSPCAGHPEYGFAAGIETTTGPLGQGVANSVGMAIASKSLSARFDTESNSAFDYNVYTLCSDGDLMEGIGCEAASVAGHLKLDNLCWIYDDNHITIEGHTDLAYTEDIAGKFETLGWNCLTIEDANDVEAIDAALTEFKSTDHAPTLIILKSIIGYGAPNKQDTHDAHGAPLGSEEISATKKFYGWPEQDFLVPSEVLDHFAETFGKNGRDAFQDWQSKVTSSQKELIEQLLANRLPENWDSEIPEFPVDPKGMATRGSSGKVLNAIAPNIPWLMGGSADLAGSNKSNIAGEKSFLPGQYSGRNMHFGVREHSMAAICNGMSLSGIRAYGATFFVFTDYMRPSMRLAALMKQNVFYILTHDSIGLGEDGPTHQPVEHLAACRAIPGLRVIRPCDANEVAMAYRSALNTKSNPTALVLTRQNVPTLDREKYGSAEGALRGGYVLKDSNDLKLIIIATGSEVSLALEAAEVLESQGIGTRVVSMPCCEIFDDQDASYRESVLPSNITARVAVEAGIRLGWDKYVGVDGGFVGMNSFGESAPFEELYEHFGITSDNVVSEAKRVLG